MLLFTREALVMSVCLKCGKHIEKVYYTGMGNYGRCIRCFFRWTEQDEKRKMSYLLNSNGRWVDIPDGCLAVFGEGIRVRKGYYLQ